MDNFSASEGWVDTFAPNDELVARYVPFCFSDEDLIDVVEYAERAFMPRDIVQTWVSYALFDPEDPRLNS